MLKKIFVTVLVVNFLVLNVAVGYLVYKQVTDVDQESDESVTDDFLVSQLNQDNNKEDFVCDENCQRVIREKVTALIPTQTTGIPVKLTPIPTVKPTKSRFFSYIPIPGSGNTSNTVWTDLAGTEISFSVGDYVGFKEAYFEVNMKLFNGNGVGYLRLYDITNSRAVDGSEISTSSQTSTAVSSGKISLWQGNNKYRVQAKSLTADTTYFESGRIKIINEQ